MVKFRWMKKRVGEHRSQEGEGRFLKVAAIFGLEN